MIITLAPDQALALTAVLVGILVAVGGLIIAVLRGRTALVDVNTKLEAASKGLQEANVKAHTERVENQARLDKMMTDHTLQLKETNDRLTEVNNRLQQVTIDMNTEISVLKGRMIEKEKVEAALSERVQRMSERNIELSKRYDQIEKEKDEALQSDAASREALQKANMTISAIQQDLDKFRFEASTLRTELDKTKERVTKLERDLTEQVNRIEEYRVLIGHMRHALRSLMTLIPILPGDIQQDFKERGIDLAALTGDPLAATTSKVSTATLRAVTPPTGVAVSNASATPGG